MKEKHKNRDEEEETWENNLHSENQFSSSLTVKLHVLKTEM